MKGASVASVFVESSFRGNGYASVMMRLLRDRLRDESIEMAASNLYSDIGPDFYNRPGLDWTPHDASEIQIRLNAKLSSGNYFLIFILD